MQSLEEDIIDWSQEQGWEVTLLEAGFMQDYPREFAPRTLTITNS